VGESTQQTKVFRVEILKPLNYSWAEFGTIASKATYASAQLANEVMTKQLLLSKKAIQKGESFCSMIETCRDSTLSFVVKCAVCRQAQLKYSKLAKKLLRADISLPTFHNNVLCIKAIGVRLAQAESGDWIARIQLLPGRGAKQPEVLLRTKELEVKSSGYYQILQRIADGSYKMGFCQVQRDRVRHKLYLLMSYTFTPESKVTPVSTRVMGVDLGIATPAVCAFNDSVKRLSLHVEGQKLLRMKWQIQARRRGVMREITRRELRRGHGLSGKFHPMQELQQKWVNFRRTWNHTLSSRVVDFAVQNQAAVIHIEDLSVDGIPRFLGRDWPVAELLQMITYKGEAAGIKVERVNPYKTSQVCSRCGVIKEDFSFKDRVAQGMPIFVCESCGFQDNADYNGAKNIARSTLTRKPSSRASAKPERASSGTMTTGQADSIGLRVEKCLSPV